MIWRRILAGGLALALLAAAWAAHRQVGPEPAAVHAASTTAPVNAGFARGMLVHHDQAVSMSRLAQGRAGPSVRALAQGILEQQLLEIGWFQGWLTVWGLPPDGDTDMRWMEQGLRASGIQDLMLERLLATCRANGMQMTGLVAASDMDELSTLRGDAFDRRFLGLMVVHHEGAIVMARFASELAESEHVRNVARSIQLEQAAEIAQMRQIALALAAAGPASTR